jgi:Hint domain
MAGFIEGVARGQAVLFPDRLDDWIGDDSLVRVVDFFVDELRDVVRSYSGATAQVKVVDEIHLDQDFLRRAPGALPIRIPANSIGPGRPSNDLFVSLGQEVSLDAHVATAFQKVQLLSGPFRMDLSYATGLTYYRFHCGTPTVIKVDGIWLRIQPWAEAS